MTALLTPTSRPAAPAVGHRFARVGLLTRLGRPADVFAHLTPNWYASIMGTGIVAVAAASLPIQLPGLRGAATGVWAVAALLLIALTAATAVHWVHHPATARGHARHPMMMHFYGAAPMALMTVGAATLLLGRDVLGLRVALDLDWALWTVGSVTGAIAAVFVPLRGIWGGHYRTGAAFGGWLMPLVPPMVSASTGALLVPHAAAAVRPAMLAACYTMFCLSLAASLIVIALIARRMAVHGVGEARLVPTVWIVLGPLGQSITAANLLGRAARGVVPSRSAHALYTFGLAYGVIVWVVALLWAALALLVTARTVRRGLPFSLTWWSFTFPVGTCVTGTSALALHTGAGLFRDAATVFYVGLVAAWVLVAARTLRASLNGELFLPPAV